MPRRTKHADLETAHETTTDGNEDAPGDVAQTGDLGAAAAALVSPEDDDGGELATAAAASPPDVPRDSRGIPLAAVRQRTLAELFQEHGIDAKDAALPYFRVKGKPQTVRIAGVEPTPAPRAFRDGTITTLARLKVEDEDGRTWLLDVTSARLLSQLGSMEEGRWLLISKSGSGLGTIYDVSYADAAPAA